MSKRTLQVEDLWRFARPAHPTLSPDGSQVCVSVTTYDMDANKGASKLWLLSTFGGEPRALTEAGEKDAEPQWSPDGRLIAFVAKRGSDEESQLWVIAPDGGEARKVTTMPTGVASIRWFPDSKRIAFVSWVWPSAQGYGELELRRKEAKESPVKAHVVENDDYRYWDHWLSDGRVPRLFVADLDGRRIVDLFAGTPYELPRNDPDRHHYDIAPDGREIAFNWNPAPDKRFDHELRLMTLDLKAREFRDVARGTKLSMECPSYSPDGKRLAFLTRNLKRSHLAEARIAILDRKRGRIENLPGSWDRSAEAPLAWEDGSETLLFAAESDARRNLFRWRIGAKRPEVAALGGTVAEFDVRAGTTAFVRHSISTPPQVFCRRATLGERRVDRFNDEVMAGIALGEVREYVVRGWNGEKVQVWVTFPPGFDPKRRWPLLHNIHGGPHAMFGDSFHFRWNNQAFAAQGYVVACVNYHGSSSFGQKFVESIECDWGRREFADIEAATDFLLAQGWIDPRRLLASGGSYGGYLVAWMNGHTDRYQAYVCHAGCFDWVSMFAGDVWYWFPKELGAWYWEDPKRVDAQSPRAFARRMKTPTLVIHGQQDYRVPDGQGLAYFNTLRAKGVTARLVFFPDENHWILKPQNSRLWYREFFAWLARFAKPGAGKRR